MTLIRRNPPPIFGITKFRNKTNKTHRVSLTVAQKRKKSTHTHPEAPGRAARFFSGHFRFERSSSPCPFAATTADSGIVMNCGGCTELASACGAKLKMTPPFDGVAYITPWGVWYTRGERIEGWDATGPGWDFGADGGRSSGEGGGGCWDGGVEEGLRLLAWKEEDWVDGVKVSESASCVSASLLSLESMGETLSSWKKKRKQCTEE